MLRIKQVPQDFFVKEISSVKIRLRGTYSYFLLRKENYNTTDALRLISWKIKFPLKKIGFAGNKDKKALTEQVISLKGIKPERLKNLKIKKIQLIFLGQGEEPLYKGNLKGNYFEIVIRNLEKEELKIFLKKVTKKIKKEPGKENSFKIINFFGEQRFSQQNEVIGKKIILKEFSSALNLINHKGAKKHLEKNKRDFVGALKKVPFSLLNLYVKAYQSFLWNETVKEVIKKKLKIKKVPLVGFASDLKKYPQELRKIIEKLLEKENLSLGDFLIREIPSLSLEGEERKVFVEVKDFQILEKGEDELNPGKKKIKVSFTLPKGSYGTRVIKELGEGLRII